MRSNIATVLVVFFVSKQYYESKPEEECGAVLHSHSLRRAPIFQLLQEDEVYVHANPGCPV